MRQADLVLKAAGLLQTYGIVKPPVPIERIAKALEIQIAYEPFAGDLSGMLFREPKGTTVVAVNSLNAKTRQRFTIAHEIAHLLLHEPTLQVDRPISVRFRDGRSGLAVDDDEIEANQFAAELLMPWAWVLNDANRLLKRQPAITDEAVVEELSEQYGVSRQAMEFRLTNLGLLTPF